MRLGIFLPNWIGDVVMATPAIRALREHVGANGQLIGIMRPYVADVLAGTSWFDEVIQYEKQPGRFPLVRSGVVTQLRDAKLDSAVLLTNSLRTAWMAWRSGAGERIGFVGEGRTWLLTTRLPRQRRGALPTIDGYLRVAAAAGCQRVSHRLELATTDADERLADYVWNELGLPSGERVIMLNSGGAFGAAKHWPAEHFADLARRLATRGDYHVLVNCGPAERQIAQEIVRRAGDSRVVTIAHLAELPVGLTKACIRRSRLVVSTDSGPRFMAIAFGKLVVTIFGPTDPAATATAFPLETCLSLKLSCQPCMKRVCPLGHHRCMRDLSVDLAYGAVARALIANVAHEAA